MNILSAGLEGRELKLTPVAGTPPADGVYTKLLKILSWDWHWFPAWVIAVNTESAPPVGHV